MLHQVNIYAELLRAQCTNIKQSYQRVCHNLSELKWVAKRHPDRHELVKSIADGTTQLYIDPEPSLLVFGYKADQRNGEDWKPHEDTLRRKLVE